MRASFVENVMVSQPGFLHSQAAFGTSLPFEISQEALKASWLALLACSSGDLPVNVSALCHSYGIYVRSYVQAQNLLRLLHLEQSALNSAGFSFFWRGEHWILYDEDRPLDQLRFTVAHELGHCLLHHLDGQSSLLDAHSSFSLDALLMEQQADLFAAALLSPACVLWGRGVTQAEQIAALCCIPSAAAECRMQRLHLLYLWNERFQSAYGQGFLMASPLERRVYQKFVESTKNIGLIS